MPGWPWIALQFARTRIQGGPWSSIIARPAITFVRLVRSNGDARLRAFSRHTRAGCGPVSVPVPKIVTDLLFPGVGSIVATKVATSGLDAPCQVCAMCAVWQAGDKPSPTQRSLGGGLDGGRSSPAEPGSRKAVAGREPALPKMNPGSTCAPRIDTYTPAYLPEAASSSDHRKPRKAVSRSGKAPSGCACGVRSGVGAGRIARPKGATMRGTRRNSWIGTPSLPHLLV